MMKSLIVIETNTSYKPNDNEEHY